MESYECNLDFHRSKLTIWEPFQRITYVATIVFSGTAPRCILLYSCILLSRIFYHNVVYLLAYYNVFLGIVSVLLRMLYIAAFNVVMLLRLNRPLMPRGWEKWDFGKS